MTSPLVLLRLNLLSALALSACGAEPAKKPSFDASPRPCENNQPLTQSSDLGIMPTGWEECADGRIHRASAETCYVVSSAIGTCGGRSGTSDAACWTEGCPDGELGYCNAPEGEDDDCACHYVPQTDADCGAGHAAWCDGVEGACIQAGCVTDADCGEGYLCVFDAYWPVNSPDSRYQACESARDDCRADQDCQGWGEADTSGYLPSYYCGYNGTRFTCLEALGADGGRPFTVGGGARVAGLVRRDDWAEASVGVSPEPEIAALLAAYWVHIGAMEHASVASFARFTLHLMALGAPPELVLDAQRAGADEVVHARLAWGLAARFGGAALGPGPLDLTGALGAVSPTEILRALIVEGCVGETLAAAEARVAAERCVDPGVRAVLTQIAEDEARHAALAWRALRWMVQVLDPALAEGPAGEGGEGPDLSAWGLPSPASRAAIRRDAWAQVVLPLVAALLGPQAQVDLARC